MKVVISAGGTGGHIYPALAILEKIKKEEPDSEFIYIGTDDRMEKDIVPSYGIPFESIKMIGLNSKKPLKNIKSLIYFLKSTRKVKKILKTFKPDVVIGVGGYVTGPVITTAHRMGFKTFIHEQNSVPGKANLFLAKYADKIGISFKETVEYFPPLKTSYTGNPRSEIAVTNEPYSKKQFGLDNAKKLVLFVMGSLGASKVNDVINKTLPKLKDEPFEVLYVTGKADYNEIIKNEFPPNIFVVPYIDDLTRILAKTDLIITRAGASTLSEIAALKVPSIIIPSPYVPNNHQYKNAKPMHDACAAELIEEKDLDATILAERIKRFINDDIKLLSFKTNMKNFAVLNSATKIYNIIKDLIGGQNE